MPCVKKYRKIGNLLRNLMDNNCYSCRNPKLRGHDICRANSKSIHKIMKRIPHEDEYTYRMGMTCMLRVMAVMPVYEFFKDEEHKHTNKNKNRYGLRVHRTPELRDEMEKSSSDRK